MKSLIELAGVECRIAPMHHHVIAEAHFDGAWRVCDALFFGSHFPVRDGHWLSVEELWADPYFTDTISQAYFVFADDCVRSRDGYYTLGYNFGTWSWEPYYSYYVGADFDTPPTLPTLLPAKRLQGKDIELRWVESIKRGGGAIEYGVGIYADRQRRELVHGTFTKENALTWEVPDQNRMYFVAVQAMDDHREKNPDTWYPTTTSNFVLVPPDQYGWYGIY